MMTAGIFTVSYTKTEIRPVPDRSQRRDIPRIGQLIQADNPVRRMLPPPIPDEVASDKTGPAGNQQIHGTPFSRFPMP